MSESAPIRVVAVDDELIVVDKPPGLHCHPLEDDDGDTLLDRVVALHPEVRGPLFPSRDGSLLHRLDVGTSGLVAFARTRAAFERWRARFSHDLDGATDVPPIEKIYLALVDGDVRDALVLEQPIAHHEKSKARMVVVHARTRHRGHPRAARTVVVPIARSETTTLVAVSLHGGRRHQIRVHLADAGHPLTGDTLYKGAPRDDGDGLLLHAALLALDDARVHFCAPPASFLAALAARGLALPAELRAVLRRTFSHPA
jgi:23S rRNA pseudouridine1911/1915/1917 synthase